MDDTVVILDELYESIEAFANAQSRQLNAYSNNITYESNEATDVSSEIEYLESCRQKMQMVWGRIFRDEEMRRKYPSHLGLSARVIETVVKNPTWSAMGIPSHSDGILESNTVALASLRASLAKIKEAR